MNKIGIIAAKGNLSKKLIDHARNHFDLFIVAINGETDSALLEGIDHIWVNIGEIGMAMDAMRKANIVEVVFVGSLKKPDIFSLSVDKMGAKLLAKIVKDKFFGDNKLLSVLTDFLEDNGFKVIGVQEILKDLVVEVGEFTVLKPSEQDRLDIELGLKVVKELGMLDIGQGAIIENGVVLGVEAIEGTDNLIKRCGELKRTQAAGGVLIKLSKPNQELRMDLPTIGIETIKNMHISGFKGIVIEARKAIFLDKEEVIAFANKHEMFVSALLVHQ